MANHRTSLTLAFALMTAAAAQAAPTYELIDLGANTLAVGINHKGHVAGAYDRVGRKQGIWSHGAWHKVKTDQWMSATGIGGQDIVSLDLHRFNGHDGAGALLPGDQIVDIEPLLPGSYSSGSAAVTSDGTVVGTYYTIDGAYTFTWRDNVATTLPCPPEYVSCLAHAASPSRGWIAGIGPRKNDDFIAAMLYDGSTWKDLGTLGGWVADATGVNRKGHVVGTSETRPDNFRTHAFIHEGKFMKDLKTLGGRNSYAYAINSHDVVVGRSEVSKDQQDSAFYWDGSGPMIDLNTLVTKAHGLHVVDAVAINDDGWIAGNATYWDTYHAVLLKPVSR